MKSSSKTVLVAALLLTGCVQLPKDPTDPGDPFARRFKLEFDPVRSVSVESFGSNADPASQGRVVRIQGLGSANGERGSLSLSYRLRLDGGCKDVAERAQKQSETLVVTGYGTVAAAIPTIACACPTPVGGTATGGTVPGNPGEPGNPGGPGNPGDPGDPGNPGDPCTCPPVLTTFIVQADLLTSCHLGRSTSEPPLPSPSPTATPVAE